MTAQCVHILDFLARAACHLKKPAFVQTLIDVSGQGGWDDLVSAIKEAEHRVVKHSTAVMEKTVRMIQENQKRDQLVQQTGTRNFEAAAREKMIRPFLKELINRA